MARFTTYVENALNRVRRWKWWMKKNTENKVWNNAGMWSAVERYRYQQRRLGLKGRCKEKAIMRSFDIQKNDGLYTRLQNGKYKGQKHTWLEVYNPLLGKWLVDDSSQGIPYTKQYTLGDLKGYEPTGTPENQDWEIRDEASKKAYLEQRGA